MGRLPLTGGRPAGLRVQILHDDVALAYTILAGHYTAMIVNSHELTPYREAVRREGINLASLALLSLRMFGQARTAPFPRLHSLLDAIGDAPKPSPAMGTAGSPSKAPEQPPGSSTRSHCPPAHSPTRPRKIPGQSCRLPSVGHRSGGPPS